ncbi:Uma2 family endonuclease [Phormidium tenue]|jgi:Uma2 family endonuclease|uniref:Uma2 family endonuclease n=1 Tax=Phormidium tenue FACHB-1050 TaxID=2692857 RepID=A0ABR8C9A5_9CYAN|nr:Uma2 family endonuclease [Phormidium tenue]MBD2316926.1 Uma2 family endonuclease [Phormidium tenue FACHB-1050]
MPVQLLTHKFTTEQYHLMHEAGVFAEGDRLELINGEITEMSPIGRKHAACVNRLVTLSTKKLGDRIIASVQNPIRLADNSEPQPDLAILKPRNDFYENSLPTPVDILLIIEVADSTITYDREIKSPLYAAAGIPEMWLFDVNRKIIEGYSQPSVLGYKRMQRYEQNDTFSMLAFPDVTFAWQEVF